MTEHTSPGDWQDIFLRDAVLREALTPASDAVPRVRALYATRNPVAALNSRYLDRLMFGMPITDIEAYLLDHYPESLAAPNAPDEQLWDGTDEYVWTPYELIKRMFNRLKLSDEAVVCDAGAGYFRVPFFGAAALGKRIRFRGIEVSPGRAAVASIVKRRLGLQEVEIVQGSMPEQDVTDVTAFYLHAPFTAVTFSRVLDQIETVARLRLEQDKSLTVATTVSRHFRYLPWLQLAGNTGPFEGAVGIDIYQTTKVT